MKKIVIAIGAVLSVFLISASAALAVGAYLTAQGGTGTTSPSGILYGDNGATSHLNTVTIGTGLTFSSGTLSNNNAGTVTQVNTMWPVLGGPITNTGTISWGGLATTSNPTAGNLFYSNGTNGLVPVSTSSPTNGTGISLSGTGSVVGGSLTITNTSPLSGLTTSFPLSFSNPTLSWIGLATTSQPANSNVLVSNGTNGIYGAATTTASCVGTISCSTFNILGSSPITLTGSASASGLSTTSPVSTSNVLYYNGSGAGSATGVATTSLSISGPFTIPNPIGVLSNGSVTYWGLSTTSQPSSSNLLVSNGAAGVYGVATTTPTLGLGLSYTGTLGTFVGGTSGNLTIATSSLYTGSVMQIPYFTGTNTLGASPDLSWNNTNLILNLGTSTLNATTQIKTGGSFTISSIGDGGGLTFNASAATSSGNFGGAVNIGSGVGSTTGNGGTFNFNGGNASSNASNGTGNGGGFNLNAGNGGGSSGAGGNIAVFAGSAIGTNSNAGSIQLDIGASTGTGVQGSVKFTRGGNPFFIALGNSKTIGIGTSTPSDLLTLSTSTASQIVLTDASLTSNRWNFRGAGGNLYLATSSPSTYSTSTLPAFEITSAGNIAFGTTTTTSIDPSHPASLLIDSNTNNANTEEGIDAIGNVNDFYQINAKNLSTGTNAQACSTATTNIGNNTTGFVSICANNHNFWNPQTFNVGGPGDTSIMGLSTGDFYLDQGTVGKKTYFLNGGTSTSTNVVETFSGNSVGIGSTSPFSEFSISTTTQSSGLTKLLTVASTTGSELFSILGNGRIGIASSTPNYLLSLGNAITSFFVSAAGEIVGYDLAKAWNGRITPTRRLSLSTATTTTWTGTTTGAYVPSITLPFTGTLRDMYCSASTTAAFLGVAPFIGTTALTPNYAIASTTVGIVSFTANNTFNQGDVLSLYVGTSTAVTANQSVSCTFDLTETP